MRYLQKSINKPYVYQHIGSINELLFIATYQLFTVAVNPQQVCENKQIPCQKDLDIERKLCVGNPHGGRMVKPTFPITVQSLRSGLSASLALLS